MGNSIKDSIVIKDIQEPGPEVEALFNLMKRVPDKEKRKQIFKDIALFKHGLEGEKKVMYELKNSFIPMHIFHNVRLTQGDLSAQIDFIVITYNYIIILETKQLMGDIEITADGEFVRYFKNAAGKWYKKEAIYSPLAQSERHVNLVRKMLRDAKIIENYPVISLVVLANPKCIVNKAKAPEAIANRVCRADQLITVMKKIAETGDTRYNRPEKGFLKSSEFILANQSSPELNFMEKYHLKEGNLLPQGKPVTKEELSEYMYSFKEQVEEESKKAVEITLSDSGEKPAPFKAKPVVALSSLESALKAYRLEQSKKLEISPPYIFSNKEMEQIIAAKPTTRGAVAKIPGFGPKKMERHADDIVALVKKNM